MSASAALHETHVGLVVLCGDRAYKAKKPVRTDFLDFGTPVLRRAALARELELNRRLAPDVYLGLGELTGPDGPAEPVLVMRRMPAERRLSTLVRSGEPVDGPLRDLARLLAAFHARADRSVAIAADGDRDALTRRWADNLDQLAPFRDRILGAATVDGLARLSGRFLAGRGPLFAARVAGGHVVDGHGDLIADDVFCLDDGPRVLDCLEFDDHLRHVDVLDDAAFLAMDLERLGRPDLAELFLEAYAEFSGDPAPPALVHHYVAYRAVVRAKVACLRHDQGESAAAGEARRYAGLALGRLRSGAVRLALVGGLPGTGKSTVAGALADRFGAVLLSSDRIRKEEAGLDPLAPADAPFGQGLYTPESTAGTYDRLLHRAGELLVRGESVVLDASWTSAAHRAAAERLAADTAADLVPLECRARPAVAAARIRTRARTASDATARIAAAMAETADPWPEATGVDTERPVEESVECAVGAWYRAVRAPAPARS